MIDEIMNAHGIFWVIAGWFVLYIVAIFYILYCMRECVTINRIIVVTIVVVFLLFYNPVVIQLLLKYMAGTLEYTRIGWGFLIVPVVAYVLTQVVTIEEKRSKRNVAVILGFLLLISIKSGFYFEIPDNIYKISDETIELVEILDENTSGEEYVTVPMLKDSLADIDETTSTYDRIMYEMGCYSFRYLVNPSTFNNLVEAKFSDAYVITESGKYEEYLNGVGYVKIAETRHCCLYKNMLL